MTTVAQESVVHLGLLHDTASGSEQAVVSVCVDTSALPVYSIDLEISYDPAAMSIAQVEKGEVVQDFSVVVNTNQPGRILAGLAGANPFDERGEILELSFDTDGEPDISILKAEINEGLVEGRISTNTAPVATGISEQLVDEGTSWSIGGLAQDTDIPANTLQYELLTAPAGMLLNEDSGTLSWDISEEDGPCTNVVQVRIIDNGMPSLSVTNSFEIVVSEVNEAPEITQESNKEIQPNEKLQVDIEVTDPDVPEQQMEFTLEEAPEGAEIDPESGGFSWTPDNSHIQTTNMVTVNVNDDGEPSKSDTMSFLVIVGGSLHEIEITNIQVSDEDKVIIKFRVNPGYTYQVQRRERIDDTGWTDVGEPITASEEYVEFIDDTPLSGSKYYRVIEIE
ncbi:MAG: hypothetical protein K9N48_01895 [Verrucomicrobia bacterium]|nr:hypothetical protein [Verrucomicrobiota bacterium]